MLFREDIRWISGSVCTSTVSDPSIRAVFFRRDDVADRDVSIVSSSANSKSSSTEGGFFLGGSIALEVWRIRLKYWRKRSSQAVLSVAQ